MLFADDEAVETHTQQELQTLMDRFFQACKDFGLIISLKKTNVLGKDTEDPPVIAIDDYKVDVVHQFTYIGSTISDNLSLEKNRREDWKSGNNSCAARKTGLGWLCTTHTL